MATVDRNGVETTFAYDALYREIERYNSKDGRENGTATAYSMSGLLLETANREEGYTYHYDDFGRVIEISNASSLKKVYTYDKDDRVTSLKAYQSSVLEMDLAYEYDAAGQLTAVVSDGVRTTYAYDDAGRLIEETNGLTGLKTQYFFTPAGQLSAEFVFGADGVVKCYAYEYDRNGNQTLKAEGTEETRYYYDAIGRLETAELPDGRTQHFSYDARGNRVEMAEIQNGYIQVTTYAYDLNNCLLYSENDTELCRYEYDAQGNQTRRIRQNTAFGSVAETEFIWNGDNMLAYSIDPDGLRSSYGYGPDGLRVRKTVGDATTRFFYEGGNILMELDGSHRITAKTTRGIRLISRETLTTEYGYLLDGHGDVAALVNPAGELVLDYAYDPFGSETDFRPDNADTWDNPFRYCGEYWDRETETYYLRARQYDPEAGRFLSEDTHWNPGNVLYGDHPRQLSQGLYAPNMLAIMQGSNAYVYCVNDPLKYMDVSGNAVVWVFFATYGYAIISSPDFQLDLEMLAFDLSQGDYFSATFGVIDILSPGISGSRIIPKLISKYSDDVGDAVKSAKKATNYTKYNFRRNLKKLTGISDASGLEAHHVLPQKFEEKFDLFDIKIHEPQYGAWVDATEHHKWSYKYNKEWKEFLDNTTDLSKEKILKQAEVMAEKYGFEVNFN